MKSFNELLVKQRDFFQTGKTKDVAFRMQSLSKLSTMIKSHEAEIMAALKKI